MSAGWFWLSTDRMTVAVRVSDGVITDAPPIVRKFIGQRPENLGAWLRKQGGFAAARLPAVSGVAASNERGGS